MREAASGAEGPSAHLRYLCHQDVLVTCSVVLSRGEPHGGGHEGARTEPAQGRVAEHGGHILVFIRASHFLQHNVALHGLAALRFLALHGEGLALLHHSHDFRFHCFSIFFAVNTAVDTHAESELPDGKIEIDVHLAVSF